MVETIPKWWVCEVYYSMGLVEWGNHNFWTSGPTSCNIHKASGAGSDLRWGFAVASRWKRLKLERCLNQFGTYARWKCSGVSEATGGWRKAVANLMSCLVCKDFPNMQFLSKEKTTVKFPSRNRKYRKCCRCRCRHNAPWGVSQFSPCRDVALNSWDLLRQVSAFGRLSKDRGMVRVAAGRSGSQPRHHLSKKGAEDWGLRISVIGDWMGAGHNYS